MPTARPGLRTLVLVGVGLGVLWLGVVLIRDRLRGRATHEPPPVVATTRPTTLPAPAPLPPQSYMELVRHTYRSYPTTRPLDGALTLEFAGHLALNEPVYLDNTGRLWLTREDAEATELVLEGAARQQVILTRERPLYVHWVHADGRETPHVVCAAARGGGFELVSAKGRQSIGGDAKYDWARARSWDGRIVVPTDTGASVFTLGRRVLESPSPPLARAGEAHAPVQITFSTGPIAWIPPREGHAGSAGAVRCIEEAWSVLSEESGWPTGLVHLIPLLDGSVLQFIADEGDLMRLNVVPLDPMDEQERNRIAELIGQLSDPDGAKRGKAYEALTRYGPGLWPVAEKMIDDEPAETRARLRDLLRSKVSPLLGGMQLIDGRLRVVRRYADGGVLFYAENGVSIPRGDEQPLVIAPAWLTALPGDSIRLLSQQMVRGLEPDKAQLTPWGAEWIVTDAEHGPRRFLAGELVPLLRKSERRFSEFVGIGRGGRYVFRDPTARVVAATRPTTQAATQPAVMAQTLIIDPHLPDPIPRLPVWQLEYPNATVGWDKNDWPAARQKSGWALGAGEWRVLKEDEPFYSTAEQVPKWSEPSTRPATAPESRPAQEVILVDAAGTRYFDGRSSLKLLKPDGTMVQWALPPEAAGDGDVHLVRCANGLLFLFNKPGRVVRIRPTPGEAEAFAVDAVFTRRIPSVEHPTRIWLDPFGRICMAWGETHLTLMFPEGYIPPAVMNLMPAQDPAEWLEE